jgi:membrane associated rhomboid family serine protease
MINMGARYQPCMHNMPNVQNSTMQISWPCPNATATTGASVSCSLSELCGFGGVPNPHIGGSIKDKPAPNQWYRFIIPIFIHAGIIHIGFNLLLQLTLGRDIEKLIGSIRFFFVYFASGIWGFVLGGNFAATGIASCGCSGSLFGILAITLLDLLYTWKDRKGPVKDLMFIVLDVCIAFVLGLLPGLDNFSHIGGFLMGLVLGVCILRSPTRFSRRIPTTTTYGQDTSQGPSRTNSGLKHFVSNPVGFFQDRQGIWWAWWIVRFFALVGVLIGFILLLKNFYEWRTTCDWCKYLSCLPVTVDGSNWCQIGNLDFSNTTSKRSLEFMMGASSFNPMEHLGAL